MKGNYSNSAAIALIFSCAVRDSCNLRGCGTLDLGTCVGYGGIDGGISEFALGPDHPASVLAKPSGISFVSASLPVSSSSSIHYANGSLWWW